MILIRSERQREGIIRESCQRILAENDRIIPETIIKKQEHITEEGTANKTLKQKREVPSG